MEQKRKNFLQEAMNYCNENDKSTEFMLQYMQDVAGVDLDTVIKFLETDGGFETLSEANHLAKELAKWQHIETRLSCGTSFYGIKFIGNQNKTMEEIETWIEDSSTIKAYHTFVKERIKDCEKKLEKL